MFCTANPTVNITGTLVAWRSYIDHPELPCIRRFASNALRNSSLQTIHAKVLSPRCKLQQDSAARCKGLGSEPPSELEPSSSSSDENDDPNGSSIMEATFDLKLPRRNLMVQFTCNACGERTHRTINRVAYERGTVFLQCGGCQQYHKFVDNLGLVVEYNFRSEMDNEDSDAKQ